MIALTVAIVALLFAVFPTLLFLVNLRHYRPAPEPTDNLPAISVLIPARNEAASIEATVRGVLASRGVTLEVVVLDDHSEDETGTILRQIAAETPLLRLPAAPELPSGWSGKNHACWILSQSARYPLLVFLDADIRLEPDALARLATGLKTSGAQLLSGIPRQETDTWLEKLIVPLIHFLMLGFLPLGRMRASTHPSYAAGCGQLFVVRREDYEKVGGHAAIRGQLFDGMKLPRAFRLAGLKTDLVDATDLATCRMYSTAGALWQGFARYATEGLAAPGTIIPASLLLLGGQVLPFVLLALLPWLSQSATILTSLAIVAAYFPRFLGSQRFHQSLIGALMHPLGILLVVAIQWYALGRKLLGQPALWKGRMAC